MKQKLKIVYKKHKPVPYNQVKHKLHNIEHILNS